jgi:hypothetical protein
MHTLLPRPLARLASLALAPLSALALLAGCDADPTPAPEGGGVAGVSAGVSADMGEPSTPDMTGAPTGDMGGALTPDMEPLPSDMEVIVEPDLEPPPLRPLTLNSVVPSRGAQVGGDEVQLVGTGFVEGMQVTFDRVACADLRVETSSRARCVTPPGEVLDAVDVVVYAERVEMGVVVPAQATLEGGFTYYVPLRLDQVSPARGPTSGGTVVTLSGEGFTAETTVQFGGVRATSTRLNPNGTLSATAPAAQAGAVSVRLQNANGDVTRQGGYYYYDRLEVTRLTPPVGPLSGGTAVVVEGRGLEARSRVSLGGRAAEVQGADGGTLSLTTPRGDAAGPAALSVLNDNGELEVPDAFIYYDESAAGFDVAGIAPQSGPLAGGQEVFVAGSGFTQGLSVSFDDRIATCEVLDAHRARCVTPPGAAGVVDVVARQGAAREELIGAYTYFQALSITSIFPNRGSIAGGALVELSGQGFTAEMEVLLGEQPLLDLQVIDELTAIGTTPPSPAGSVDVIARTSFTRDIIDSGYEYFDPTSQYGGVWGEGLDVSLNVTVLNANTFEPEPEVYLLLITRQQLILEGLTDGEGRDTLSHPRLTSPATLTAAKEGFEVTTVERVGVENITILLLPQPEGQGAPPPGVPPATLRGTVRGLDLIPKPSSEVYVNVVVVETSHDQPRNKEELPPPGPGGLLLEDGPFEISARLGELAVVATAGRIQRLTLDAYNRGELEYWEMRAELEPAVMGVRRFVAARSGEVTDGLFVELDHPLDFSFPVDFDNPPYDPQAGVTYYAVLPSINFGAEGFWQLDTVAVEMIPNLSLSEMPRLDGWGDDVKLFMFNLAFNPQSADNTPLSINIKDTRVDSAGVFVTPFAPAAILNEPLMGAALGDDRVISWRLTSGYDGPIAPPSATVVSVAEPALGPPTPLWRYVVPSSMTEVQIPQLSSLAGGAGLNGGFMFLDVMPFVAEGRFDYDDFTYLDINGARWASYGITSSNFIEQ